MAAASRKTNLCGYNDLAVIRPGESQQVPVWSSEVVTLIADQKGYEEGILVAEALELTFVKKLQIGVDVASGKLACVAGADSPFGGQAIYELASALQNERVKQVRKKRPRAGTQTVEAVDEGRPFENERRARDKPPKPKCPNRSRSRSRGSQEEELLHSESSQPKHSCARYRL